MRPGAGRLSAACGLTAVAGHWIRWRHFDRGALARLAQAIREAEAGHVGELVVAIETRLPPGAAGGRERALEVFGRHRVWDTPARSGVLLYLALGDRRIELIADRGVPVPDADWQRICADLQARLRAGAYLDGLLAAVHAIEGELRGRLANQAPDAGNRLADEPVML
ncbi:TPM domain-containing protein [Pigmentiphaga soli]|uniref:TPM domain-containing protein n=1 Tax=Pigmentiphaga soli TaxID=1007095 RepID=A0ABP8GUK3_9BURK